MGFAEEFIAGAQAGSQLRSERDRRKYEAGDQIHKQWQREVEKQDREVQKSVLQHQLKEMAIREKILSRDELKKQIDSQFLGKDVTSFGPDDVEGPGGALPRFNPLQPGEGATVFKSFDMPGIEELGIGPSKYRPQSMQEVLAQKIKEQNAVEGAKVHELGPGEALGSIAGGISFRNPAVRPEQYTTIRYQGSDGKVYTERVPESEAVARGPLQQRIPPTGGSGGQLMTDDEADELSTAIEEGRVPVAMLDGLKGDDKKVAILSLTRRGTPVTRIKNDQAAMLSFLRGLNSGQQLDTVVAANTLKSSLDNLKIANEGWNRGNWGPLNWVNVARIKALGGEQGKAAADVEAAINGSIQALVQLRRNGDTATNDALKAVENVLSNKQSTSDMNAAITRLLKEGEIRVQGIKGAQAILTDPSIVPPDYSGGRNPPQKKNPLGLPPPPGKK